MVHIFLTRWHEKYVHHTANVYGGFRLKVRLCLIFFTLDGIKKYVYYTADPYGKR